MTSTLPSSTSASSSVVQYSKPGVLFAAKLDVGLLANTLAFEGCHRLPESEPWQLDLATANLERLLPVRRSARSRPRAHRCRCRWANLRNVGISDGREAIAIAPAAAYFSSVTSQSHDEGKVRLLVVFQVARVLAWRTAEAEATRLAKPGVDRRRNFRQRTRGSPNPFHALGQLFGKGEAMVWPAMNT